ncbi:MAG: beta-ketoacyl synthase [Gammaproteobacteria bacterium]|nr:beta-ketoacyl synthase [Gammaproteobacteria bacterium]
MIKLPVIVGFGGMNASGRSSGSHGYKRMVCDALSTSEIEPTWQDLSHRMGLHTEKTISASSIDAIKNRTLIRRITNFDPDHVLCHHKASLEPRDHPASLILKHHKLSQTLAEQSQITDLPEAMIRAQFKGPLPLLIPDTKKSDVSSAGEIPNGFDPTQLYNSHHHPRGLSLSIYAASDTLNSLGFEWDEILKHIKPDDVAVYAGSGLSQVDENSLGGLFRQPLCGNRANSKMMPLSLAEMPADFINSYVINSVGSTGNNVGACASFLYNLRQGCQEIQYGKTKVAIVGNAEAPVVFDIIEGFRVMGALATDESLRILDKSDDANHQRACRPFSSNSGFTLAESAQFFVLMDAELALEMGATIYGAVPETFINADGNKKSIASPGVGNYITVAKAAALAKAMLGQTGLQNTYVQAHGTGTPQNRTTESHILNEVAKTFGLEDWTVSAIKSYVGHSISVAGGDQLTASLGVWQYGWIPGIKTIDHIADDVQCSHLNILMDHLSVDPKKLDAVLINSKGFGGNNATSLVLSPQQTMTMLTQRYGQAKIKTYWHKNEKITARQAEVDAQTCQGNERIIYNFGQTVMDPTDVTMTPESIRLSEFAEAITLPMVNPYAL